MGQYFKMSKKWCEKVDCPFSPRSKCAVETMRQALPNKKSRREMITHLKKRAQENPQEFRGLCEFLQKLGSQGLALRG